MCLLAWLLMLLYYVIGLYGTCGFKTIYIYIYVAHFTCSTHIVPYV